MAWTCRIGLDSIGAPYAGSVNLAPTGAELASNMAGVECLRIRCGTASDNPFTGLDTYVTEVINDGYFPIFLLAVPGPGTSMAVWNGVVTNWVDKVTAGLVAGGAGAAKAQFEVGNEIDKSGAVGAANYWPKLRAASVIIRSGAHGISGRVIMSSAGVWSGDHKAHVDILQAAKDEGNVFSYVDGVAVHPYSRADPPAGTQTSAATGPGSGRDKLNDVRAKLDAFGGYAATLDLWATEHGWATGPTSGGGSTSNRVCDGGNGGTRQGQQRNRLVDSTADMMAAASAVQLRALVWFASRDYNTSDPNTLWPNYCGVKKEDLTKKDAYGVGSLVGLSDQTSVIDNNVPDVTTGAGTQTGPQAATVNGTVHPKNHSTRYWVQFGDTNGYGQVSLVGPAITGNAAQGVSASITGLSNGVNHYRFVAKNEAGIFFGPDGTIDMGGVVGGSTGVREPISGLTAGTTYYFRLTGTTSSGTVVDGIRSFIATAPASEPVQVFPPSLLPLGLTVEIETADGKFYVWDPNDLDPKNRPQDITFATSEGNGFAEASCVLSRPIGLDYADLGLLDRIRFLGADASTVWEGRISSTPRSIGGDAEQITVEGNGLMASARDRPMVEIYVDASAERWLPPSLLQRRAIMAANHPLDADYTVNSGSAGSIHFKGNTNKTIPIGSQAVVEYRAPDGTSITAFWYRGDQTNISGAGLPTMEAPRFYGADDDSTEISGGGWEFGAIDLSLSSGATVLRGTSLSQPRKFAALRAYASTSDSPPAAKPFHRRFDRVAVYGNHSVPLRDNGDDPPGVYASDVIGDAIDRFCPLLDSSGLDQTTVVIPHLVFDTPTDPWDVFDAVNQYHGYGLGSYENGKVFYEPFDSDAPPDWQVRSTDPGVDLSLAGETIDEFANGIVVTFTDVNQRQRVLYPTDYDALRADDLNNPANRWGTQKWTRIDITGVIDQKGALQIGAAALDDFNHPKAPGSLTITYGYLLSTEEHLEPCWRVRYGESISITDLINDTPRRINSTTWNEEDFSLSLELEQPSKSVDAVLARYGAALSVRGVG